MKSPLVVVTNFGSRGDFQPLLSLGAALARRGFRIRFALPPFAEGLIKSTKFEFCSIGPDLSKLRDDINLLAQVNSWSEKQENTLLERIVSIQPYLPVALKELLEVSETADLLISGPVQPLARIVHDLTGITFVSVQVCHFGGSGGPIVEKAGDLLVNSFRRTLGLPRVKEPLTSGANSPQLALYAMSKYVCPRSVSWPSQCRLTGFFYNSETCAPAKGLVNFIQTGTPPIVVTFGSMLHSDGDAIRAQIAAAISKSGRRAIIQGLNGCADRLEGSVYWTADTPHGWLFPKTACVVSHGGAGTSAELFRAGVPGIFVPHGDFFDQRYWAQLAFELGCAAAPIPLADLSVSRLSTAIEEVTADPAFKQAAECVAAKIRQENGVFNACQLIEELMVATGVR